MINGASQRSVATWFRCGMGRLTITSLQIYCWVSFERTFKIVQHLAKLWGEVPCVSGHCPADRWRTTL